MNEIKVPPKVYLFRQVLWFAACAIGGLTIGQLLSITYASAVGVGDLQNLMNELIKGNYPEHLTTVKIMSMVTHLGVYTCSALVFAWIIKKRKLHYYLHIHKLSPILTILLVVLAACAAYPIAIWLYYLNLQIIPEAWVAQNTMDLQARLMEMKSPFDLVMNLLLIGVIAGIGEELVFRGIIQRFLAQATANIPLAIWTAALLFSLIHFQPEGFIPRFLLGAFLGYLLYWTGNLWSSIFAHISFNSIQVLLFYYFPQETIEDSLNMEPDFSPWISITSIGLFIFACYAIWKMNQKHQLKTDAYSRIE
jgi:membrane protease YdiL (CAAX protease family)